MVNSLNNYRAILFLSIFFFTVACLDEYDTPQIKNSERLLVVEGNIGDRETSIRLSRANNLNDNMPFPVYYARVVLENESGSLNEVLSLTDNGLYHTEIALDTEDRYRIHIQDEGDEYVSEYLELLNTPRIDSIGWEDNVGVFQVHVSTHDENNNTRYYLWRFEETWRYRAISSSDNIYQGNDETSEYIPCWRTEESTSIQIGSTINLVQDIVFKRPIHVIEPTASLRLSDRYSILIKQYAISKESFEFWQLLKQNTESLGTFFDPQPSQLPTNITCINNPDKPVIGFLSASKEQQERMFVNRRDLPFRNIPFASSFTCIGSKDRPEFWAN